MKEIAEFTGEFLSAAQRCFELIDKDGGGTLSIEEMSARGVRTSTCARRGDGAGSAAILAVLRVWGGSYAIDATPYSPPDSRAASRP